MWMSAAAPWRTRTRQKSFAVSMATAEAVEKASKSLSEPQVGKTEVQSTPISNRNRPLSPRCLPRPYPRVCVVTSDQTFHDFLITGSHSFCRDAAGFLACVAVIWIMCSNFQSWWKWSSSGKRRFRSVESSWKAWTRSTSVANMKMVSLRFGLDVKMWVFFNTRVCASTARVDVFYNT